MGMKLTGPSGGGGLSGVVADAINDGVTTVAPSQNAVYDALALKIAVTLAAATTTLQRKQGSTRTAPSPR